MLHYTELPAEVLNLLRRGVVIPAMPLALDNKRQFLPINQRALVRYYLDAGARGIAVGVHSTQFEIRNPEIALFEPVLSFVSKEIDAWSKIHHQSVIKIAGICGQTQQTINEANFAVRQGYHAGLLSLSAWNSAGVTEMIAHCRTIAQIIPIIGFYLQPAAGGRLLSREFWREFAKIDNVIAVKIAPFNRYQTLDVIRGVVESGRSDEITLYTGNDDNIVIDLLTAYPITTSDGVKVVRIKGGLLGHWSVWTQKAVQLLEQLHQLSSCDKIPAEMLALNTKITDSNAAFFDAANNFDGCIPGIHEVLRRQKLLPGTWCLNPDETLSPGQSEEIDRVYAAYPELNDDEFVAANRDRWFAD